MFNCGSLKVTAVLQYKYGLIYRDVIRTPQMDLCKLMRQNDNGNKLIAIALRFMNDTAPGALHSCPYRVSCETENIATDSTESFSS